MRTFAILCGRCGFACEAELDAAPPARLTVRHVERGPAADVMTARCVQGGGPYLQVADEVAILGSEWTPRGRYQSVALGVNVLLVAPGDTSHEAAPPARSR